ncbi:MAG: hypothetical protein IK111_08330 [Lachnospiraceae bacterium]|nr:hypothetical protein [Lachnospiraceae bacterium]
MKEICIFGCGKHASHVFYRLKQDGYQIKYIFDNYIKKPFYGMPITRISECLDELNTMMILVTNDLYYKDVKEQLEKYGLKEFCDFIKADAYNKKIVFINGNCYSRYIGILLRRCEEFNNIYYVYDDTSILSHPNEIDSNLLRNCDVFIHQDIQMGNKYSDIFADAMTIPKLKKECISICIPNLVGFGGLLYPQAYFSDDFENDMFPNRDCIVDGLIKHGYSIDDIVNIVCTCKIFSDSMLMNEYKTIVSKFREREKEWDIKIIDYIVENFRSIKCFVDRAHPTDIVFRVIIKGILEILNIEYNTLEYSIYNRDIFQGTENIIYPDVARFFKLQYWSEDYELRRFFPQKIRAMNMEEYVREYIFEYYERLV